MSGPKEYKILYKNEIPKPKFQVSSDFKTKNLQRVWFWIKIFTTRQIFNQKNYNASDLEEKFS